MYKIRRELKEELLDGRTISNVAKKVGISRVHLSYIINGKLNTTKTTAYAIVKSCNSESEIQDYFERVIL